MFLSIFVQNVIVIFLNKCYAVVIYIEKNVILIFSSQILTCVFFVVSGNYGSKLQDPGLRTSKATGFDEWFMKWEINWIIGFIQTILFVRKVHLATRNLTNVRVTNYKYANIENFCINTALWLIPCKGTPTKLPTVTNKFCLLFLCCYFCRNHDQDVKIAI